MARSGTTFRSAEARGMVGDGMGRTMELRRMLADAKSTPIKGESLANAKLFKLSDTDFIRQLHTAFEPEFDILRTASAATVEQGDAVEGAYGPSGKLSPSQFLYDGALYPEVDRTIVGILCMKWILTSQYDVFTRYQFEKIKLSRDDFLKLRQTFIGTFGDSSNAYMLIVSMIINDLGKNEDLRKQLPDKAEKILTGDDPEDLQDKTELCKKVLAEVSTFNHDEIIYYASKLNLIDLITEFNGKKRTRLELGIEFGGKLNLGQLAQAENVPGSLKGLQELMKSDEGAFAFKFLEVVLDVGGAQGHVDSRCSKTWAAPVNLTYGIARDCVDQVIKGQLSERNAYDQILRHRAQLIYKNGFPTVLSTDYKKERALLRLMLMNRVDNAQAAQRMVDVLDSLPTANTGPAVTDFTNRPIINIQEAVINGLSVDGITDGLAIVPYYAPGLFAEIMRIASKSGENVLRRALSAFLRLLARAFVGTKPRPELGWGEVMECDLGFAKSKIHDPAFKTNPEILDQLTYGDGIYNKDIGAAIRASLGIRPLSPRNTFS